LCGEKMNPDILQYLASKLQRRFHRLESVSSRNFKSDLKQFWEFFDEQPLLRGIEEELQNKYDFDFQNTEEFFQDGLRRGENESEHAALSDNILRLLAESNRRTGRVVINMGISKSGNVDSHLNEFREIYLEPFFDYLLEHLNDERAVLGMLLRYKQRTEWFTKQGVRKSSNSDEDWLQKDLYLYLHDQGLNFHLEAQSSSGRIDLIEAQNTEEPLLVEVKVFDNDNRDKSYIIKGFRQIYDYVKDYNEDQGYLVIFNTAPEEIQFQCERSSLGIPMIEYNHKAISLVQIDLHEYEKSASQRGKLQTVEIKQVEFTELVE